MNRWIDELVGEKKDLANKNEISKRTIAELQITIQQMNSKCEESCVHSEPVSTENLLRNVSDEVLGSNYKITYPPLWYSKQDIIWYTQQDTFWYFK